MIDSPLVSIGALNYNNAKYVIESLDSVNNQSYPNIELIIIDDCSTDDSVVLINNWLKDYIKPYKFLIHNKNLGLVKSANDALKNSTGKYFQLLGTDDILLPDKLKIQVNILENGPNDVGVVYSDAYLIKEDGSNRYGWFIQKYSDFEDVPCGYIYNELLLNNFIPAMTPLIKMDCLQDVGRFDESLVFEDYDMWLRLSKKYKFIFSNYVSAKYRVRPGSLNQTIKNWNPSYAIIYLKHFENNGVVLEKLKVMAIQAYLGKDIQTLNIFRLSKTDIPVINFILFLSTYHVNKRIGIRLIKYFFS